MLRILLSILLTLLAATAFAAPACKPAVHAKLPTMARLSYHQARAKLLAEGWQALQTKAPDDPDIAYGNGSLFWHKGYVELEFCAGTGVAACSFLFKDKYGTTLRVETAGEEIPASKALARVVRYRFVCDAELQQ